MSSTISVVFSCASPMFSSIVEFTEQIETLYVNKATTKLAKEALWKHCEQRAEEHSALKYCVELAKREDPHPPSTSLELLHIFLRVLRQHAEPFWNLKKDSISTPKGLNLPRLFRIAEFAVAQIYRNLLCFNNSLKNEYKTLSSLYKTIENNDKTSLDVCQKFKKAQSIFEEHSEALKRVKRITITHSLSDFPEELGLCTNLEQLLYNSTPLTSSLKSLANLNKLTVLNMSGHFPKIPEVIYHLPRVTNITIHGTLQTLPDFERLPPTIEHFHREFTVEQPTKTGSETVFQMRSSSVRTSVTLHHFLHALQKWHNLGNPSIFVRLLKGAACFFGLLIVPLLLTLGDVVLRSLTCFVLLLFCAVLCIDQWSTCSSQIRWALWDKFLPFIAKGFSTNLGLFGTAAVLWVQNLYKQTWDVEAAEEGISKTFGWNSRAWIDDISVDKLTHTIREK